MKFLPLLSAAIGAFFIPEDAIATAIYTQKDNSSTVDTLYPRATSLFYVSSGDIEYNSSYGLIYKGTGSVSDSDITTLVTFEVPENWAGKNCTLYFDLAPEDVLSGSNTADVFTSLTVVERSSSDWSPGNQRDEHLGRFRVDGSWKGKWIDTHEEDTPQFECPANELIAWELVGVSDRVKIRWAAQSGNGPRMEVV
ncbi:predicted protein [Paecilomyces variotii No. 5]|uniref:Ubiquitin 3 binding protein But2 C-terminal domain-containing protein n=1 Tax=Byssochlamys spectabilis (strain No. 5 / NBRC 109023) TaxID=1356009 RepID=V5FNN7_BYSSN|nr:predicted protein [Paecilomyces variotii No. 5]